MAYSLGSYSLEVTVSDHRFKISLSTHCTGVYIRGAYNHEPPILDFAEHSLHWGLQPERLQSRATDFRFCWALLGLGPTG